jgi:hypothetical protein
METGLSGKTASAPVVFDARQWKRQASAARARITSPGAVPLADRHGRIVAGATIHAIGHPWRPTLAIPYMAFATRIFGHDRAALLRTQLPENDAAKAAQRERKIKRLQKEIRHVDAAQKAQVKELNGPGTPTTRPPKPGVTASAYGSRSWWPSARATPTS